MVSDDIRPGQKGVIFLHFVVFNLFGYRKVAVVAVVIADFYRNAFRVFLILLILMLIIKGIEFLLILFRRQNEIPFFYDIFIMTGQQRVITVRTTVARLRIGMQGIDLLIVFF